MKRLSLMLLVIAPWFIAGCATPSSRYPAGSGLCVETRPTPTEQEIESLFDRWNRSLQSGDPRQVVANYAERSVLLPTVSNKPRFTREEKEDYFHHFLENEPSGEVTQRQIRIVGDMAVDTGLYTFRFAKTGDQVRARYSFTDVRDGEQWLIVSHHSSAMPEK
ncbi:MAG: SgcJ/EcaC family oxidoreductase [Kiritimatiellia bacterium]|nr:SgcJ/EcaC family oxidoreductase [Kiritimatiellia bacterium]